MAFTPPDEKTRRGAEGGLSELSAVLQRALTPDINSFDPIPKPGPSDWLAVHEERGQTFGEFKAAQTNRPTQTRRVIYLQPLGDFYCSLVARPAAAQYSDVFAPSSGERIRSFKSWRAGHGTRRQMSEATTPG